jgi:hypothetical protein
MKANKKFKKGSLLNDYVTPPPAKKRIPLIAGGLASEHTLSLLLT